MGGVLPGAVRQRGVPVSELTPSRRAARDTATLAKRADILGAIPCSPAARCCKTDRLRLRLPRVRRAGRTSRPRARAPKAEPARPEDAALPGARPSASSSCAWTAAPSHVDTFDYKPKLTADDGKPLPQGPAASAAKLLGSPWKFTQHGQSGLWISRAVPRGRASTPTTCASLNGMHTDLPNHPQAFLQMHTGIFQFPRPSLGRVGRSTASAPRTRTCPASSRISPPANNGGPANYGSSFLPAVYQGTRIGGGGFGRSAGGAQVSNLKNPQQSTAAQRAQLDFVQSLNRNALERDGDEPRHRGGDRVATSSPSACRRELPKLMDLAKEIAATLELYGIDGGRRRRTGRRSRRLRPAVPAGPPARRGRACASSRSRTAAGTSTAT